MNTLDVVCPVFREQEVIGFFHERLKAVLDGLADRCAYRILYVLDPSPDRTEEILAGIAHADPRVEVLVLSRRFGHQAALIAGMNHSTADAVVMLDSDLQHPPELIPELVRRWKAGADVVQTLRKDSVEIGLLKRTTSRWFYSVLRKIGSVELQPGAADYRLLSKRFVDMFRSQMHERNPFLRGLVGWVGYRTEYVSFWPDKREGGRTKYSSSVLANFAINGILSFSKAPLRICISIGLGGAVLGFAGGIVQIFLYLMGDYSVPGWASLFAAVSLFGGIQLFFLGLLGEYIGLIFDEVKKRPRYLVDRIYSHRSNEDTSQPIPAWTP